MLHHICVHYYTRLSKVGNGQKSRRRKGQSALEVDSSNSKETTSSIFHLFCLHVNVPPLMSVAFCVCVSPSLLLPYVFA